MILCYCVCNNFENMNMKEKNADSANINVYFYPASWVHKAWNVIPQSAIIIHWLRVIFQICSSRISGAISIESTLMSWTKKGKMNELGGKGTLKSCLKKDSEWRI